MKKFIIPFVAIVVVIGVFVLLGTFPRIDEDEIMPPILPNPPAGQTETIRMKDSGYEPKNFTVAVGTSITFVNVETNDHWPASNIHPTHQIYPEFDPKRSIAPGASWSFTFDKPGIWRYHDHLYPNIKGTITVEE